jgi:hypothetical protein
MTILTFILGLLTGIGGLLLFQQVRAGERYKVWQWIVLALWFLFGLFAFTFIAQNFIEGEARAGGMSILIFGGAFLVISVLVYRFVFMKKVLKDKGIAKVAASAKETAAGAAEKIEDAIADAADAATDLAKDAIEAVTDTVEDAKEFVQDNPLPNLIAFPCTDLLKE